MSYFNHDPTDFGQPSGFRNFGSQQSGGFSQRGRGNQESIKISFLHSSFSSRLSRKAVENSDPLIVWKNLEKKIQQ